RVGDLPVDRIQRGDLGQLPRRQGRERALRDAVSSGRARPVKQAEGRGTRGTVPAGRGPGRPVRRGRECDVAGSALVRAAVRQGRPPAVLARKLITDPAGSAAHIRPAAAAVANTGPGAASTDVQWAPPSRLTSSWPGQRVVEGTARQRSDVATPSRPEKNWTWFTEAGSRAITRQCRPASVVPISVRPQEVPSGLRAEPGQATSAQ